MKAEQINQATLLGRTAHIDGKKRFPCLDTNLMTTLKTHRADIPGSASFNDLLTAWLRGWDLQNLDC